MLFYVHVYSINSQFRLNVGIAQLREPEFRYRLSIALPVSSGMCEFCPSLKVSPRILIVQKVGASRSSPLWKIYAFAPLISRLLLGYSIFVNIFCTSINHVAQVNVSDFHSPKWQFPSLECFSGI